MSMKSSRSFKNIENSIGDRLSPCLTPQLIVKKDEIVLLTDTQDFILLYILRITLKKFPFISSLISFLQRPTRHTESKALEKSMYEQNSFFSRIS